MDEKLRNELRQIEMNLSKILVNGDAAILMGDAILRLRVLIEEQEKGDVQNE